MILIPVSDSYSFQIVLAGMDADARCRLPLRNRSMNSPDVKASDLAVRIQKNNDERKALMQEAVEVAVKDTGKDYIRKGIPQSLLFMVEIIPVIHRLYEHIPERVYKSVLEVGPENFAGTELLAHTHAPHSYNRLKLNVSALDITDHFDYLRQLIAPQVEFLITDVFEIKDRVWDFSIASHVIEHVPDPVAFVRQLQSLSRDFVIIAAPWMEDPIITKSHCNTITKELVREMGARDLNIFTNYSWGKDREVCIFWLPGLAK